MTCASCVARVEKAILAVEGVENASVNLVEGIAVVNGGEPAQVANAVIDSGYPARFQTRPVSTSLRLQIKTQDISVSDIAALLHSLDTDAQIKQQTANTFDLLTSVHPGAMLTALQNAGHPATLLEPGDDTDAEERARAANEIKLSWRRAWLAGVVGAGLMTGAMTGILPAFDSSSGARLLWGFLALLCLFTMIYSGGQYYAGAWKQARHFSANMDTLIALGTGAAWLSSVMLLIWPDLIPGKKHLYLDTSVLILAFLQFGHALETRAKGKTRDAIRALTELAPATATLLHEDQEHQIPVVYLRIDDTDKNPSWQQHSNRLRCRVWPIDGR